MKGPRPSAATGEAIEMREPGPRSGPMVFAALRLGFGGVDTLRNKSVLRRFEGGPG
jgi:hypothetical protein